MQTKTVWSALLLVSLAPMHSGEGVRAESRMVAILIEADAPGLATVVNRTPVPLSIGQCEPVVESLDGDDWDPLAEPAPGCEVESSILMPGDSGLLQFPCPTIPGTYRLTIPVALLRQELEPVSATGRSEPFQAAPSGSSASPCAITLGRQSRPTPFQPEPYPLLPRSGSRRGPGVIHS